MTERSLRDLLTDGRVHVVDGAMGTMLYSKGAFLNVCYDELNLKEPDLIREIHRAYVKAGRTGRKVGKGVYQYDAEGKRVPG